MTTDFRALCARLADELDANCKMLLNDYDVTHQLANQARAALAEPEPEGPTDSELWELGNDDFRTSCWPSDGIAFARAVLARWGNPAPQPANSEVAKRLDRYDQALSAVMPPDFKDWWQNSKEEWPDIAAGVIENLRKREELAWEHVGRLAAQPISLAERLPGPGDCDAEEKCYWFDPKGSGAWYQDTYQGNYTHWLPAHALPLPS